MTGSGEVPVSEYLDPHLDAPALPLPEVEQAMTLTVIEHYLSTTQDPRDWIGRDAALGEVQRHVLHGDPPAVEAAQRILTMIRLITRRHAEELLLIGGSHSGGELSYLLQREGIAVDDRAFADVAAARLLLAELGAIDGGPLDAVYALTSRRGCSALLDVFVQAAEQWQGTRRSPGASTLRRSA